MSAFCLEEKGEPLPQYTLDVAVVGSGSVDLNPPGGTYDEGTVVQLTAAGLGSAFDSWSGDLSGSDNPTSITMTSNKSVTATFVDAPVLGWVAYNDLEPRALSGSTDNAPNVTEWDYLVTDAVLKNYDIGTDLPVTITGESNFRDPRQNGDNANTGTDAGDAFGPVSDRIVDLQATSELDAADWYNTVIFNNLDPAKVYNISLTANRDNIDYAGARYSKVTIEGADTSTNASSAGVVVNSESSVSFSIGYNTVNGYVAKWTDIQCGPDGSFSIKSEWDNIQGSGDANTKGYAMSAFCLEEVGEVPLSQFAFVVVADSRTQSHLTGFEADLMQVQDWVNSPTPDMPAPEMLVFAGDFDHTSQTDGIIKTVLGTGFPWYYVIGNHELETMANFDYCKDNIFPTLPGIVNSGPAGSVGTNYSWDHGNAHFVSVNAYWDGTTDPGADHATSGDIPVALRTWVDTDLAASSQPHKFVFVHEPAYPAVRHIGNSLDAYPANRDAFVTMLDNSGTETLFVGHDHYYHHDVASEYPLLGDVHQVDAGQIQGPNVGGDGSTIIYVLVDGDMTTYKVYRSTTGTFTLFEEWTIGGPLPLTMAMNKSEVPTTYSLGANYPNPFNPSTTIRFTLPTSENVRLSIFDIQGRQVATLVNEVYSAGRHEVIWRGQDNSSRPVASGTYFYRLKTGGFTETKKMLLLK